SAPSTKASTKPPTSMVMSEVSCSIGGSRAFTRMCRQCSRRKENRPGAPYNAAMISLRDFALRRGERLLLSGVDATLYPGWRVGVVGRNGTGKSSLFAAVRGELESDQGA